MYATFDGESAGNKADEVQTLEGANNSAIKPAGAARGETHEISTIKQNGASTVNAPATASATAEQHYDIQMDQFQVIDGKEKTSVLQSPHQAD